MENMRWLNPTDLSSPPGDGLEFVPVKSAGRVLTLIQLLTEHGQGLTFTELQEITGWPRSSLYGLVRTMAERNHLSFNSQTQKYRIGIRLWEAGQGFEQGVELVDLAMPHLEAAREQLGETVQLAVLDGIENIYIAKSEASHTLRLDSFVGARLPAFATGIGKVLLAGLEEAELDHRLRNVILFAYTSTTITDMVALREVLRKIRTQGYALDNQEYSLGVCCYAVPIYGSKGTVAASVSVSIPSVRVSQGVEAEALRVLSETSRSLSAELGYSPQSK
jgi:DNA-binding IclR family transcriptional regulator